MRTLSMLRKLFALCLFVWSLCSGCVRQVPVDRPGSTPPAKTPARGVQINWDAPQQNQDGSPLTDLGGYTIHYGTHSKHYPCKIDVGKRTSYLVTGLTAGRQYCFVVTSYDISRNESEWSPETCVTAPSSPAAAVVLSQQPLVKGQSGRFQVRGAQPGEMVTFLFSPVGVGEGPCASELGGLCVDILQPQTFGRVQADASGIATLEVSIPHLARYGGCVITQAVIRRGRQGGDSIKTNVLTDTVR